MHPRAAHVIRQLTRSDLAISCVMNRVCCRRIVKRLFIGISRLGDGSFWYVLAATMPLIDGQDGLRAALQMILTGLLCLPIYRYLKAKTLRDRPFVRHASIVAATHPLDEYSFPSGHTLHAVAFTVVALHYYPALAVLVIPFTILVALSRVILGLHFVSDVIAGACLGWLIAATALSLAP